MDDFRNQDALMARQPIMGESQNAFGYEFYNRQVGSDGHTVATDSAMLASLFSSVDMTPKLKKGLMFVNCTHTSLMGSHLDQTPSERVVIEVPCDESMTPESIELVRERVIQLKKLGFKIALNHQALGRRYETWITLADYVKIDLRGIRLDAVESAVRLSSKMTTAKVIIEKIETQEEYLMSKRIGITLFQGFWFAQPVTARRKAVSPSQLAAIQLMDMIRKNAEIIDIEEFLKKHPSISFTLLRFLNSAGSGVGKEITSFKQAVMLMGMKPLYRWAVLLMSASDKESVSEVLGATAVVRGRMMELMAAKTMSKEDQDQAFIVGVFSLLDVLMGIPMKDALAHIKLQQPVLDALLEGKGEMANILAQVKLSETTGSDSNHMNLGRIQMMNINESQINAMQWAQEVI